MGWVRDYRAQPNLSRQGLLSGALSKMRFNDREVCGGTRAMNGSEPILSYGVVPWPDGYRDR